MGFMVFFRDAKFYLGDVTDVIGGWRCGQLQVGYPKPQRIRKLCSFTEEEQRYLLNLGISESSFQ